MANLLQQHVPHGTYEPEKLSSIAENGIIEHYQGILQHKIGSESQPWKEHFYNENINSGTSENAINYEKCHNIFSYQDGLQNLGLGRS